VDTLSRRLDPNIVNALMRVAWTALPNGDPRVLIDDGLASNLDQAIYRYGSMTEALALVRHRSWRFKQPQSWSDRFEGHVAKGLFGDGAPFEGIKAYAKCFSFEPYSEPMWRLYRSDDGECVMRLSMTLRGLIETLTKMLHAVQGDAKVYVGRMQYMRPSALKAAVIQQGQRHPKPVSRLAMDALLMKRHGFLFEQEVRACFVFGAENAFDASSKIPEFHDLGSASTDAITEMLIDPYVSTLVADAWKQVFKVVYKVPFRVEQSKFDHDPDE